MSDPKSEPHAQDPSADATSTDAAADPVSPETPLKDLVEDALEDTQEGEGQGEETGEPSVEERIAQLKADLATANENVLRALADAENTRNRTRRDLETARKFAVEPLAKDLMSALDHLGRARQAIAPEALESDESLKNLYIGVEMTEKELLKAFEKNKIEQINPLGVVFDPNMHQALQHVDGTQADPGTIIEVVAPGYRMHDRLLRAAMVLVAK